MTINKPTGIMVCMHGLHKLEYYLVLFTRKEALIYSVTRMNSEDMVSPAGGNLHVELTLSKRD